MNKQADHLFKFWGKIDNIEDAVENAELGMYFAYIISGLTGLLAIASLFEVKIIPGLSIFALIDAALFALLGWGISRYSRISSVLTLIFYIFQLINNFNNIESVKTIHVILAAIVIAALLNSIRGTYYYHKLKKVDLSNV